MTFAIAFPQIDPVMVQLGPFAIRWYALAYIVGLLLGWRYVRWLAKRPPSAAGPEDVDDFLVMATLGVILGGRLGYVLFYRPDYYLDHPAAILAVWQGGMSFHGGMLGVAVAGLLFVRRRKLDALRFGDLIAAAAPIGIFLGRIANFINGELFGRVTDVPWAVVFPMGGPEPRHASQLYEAGLEGLLLFLVLHFLWRREAVRACAGVLTGVFLFGYALARAVVELVRQPDAHLGFLAGSTTMGQWLSLPMLLAGLWLVLRARPRG